VVLESTYGDRTHRTQEATQGEFLAVVKTAIARVGNVMIPTFAVERAQQVLYELYSLISSGALADLPVYLDSPMATSVTKLYQQGVAELRPEVARVFEAGGDPFDPPSLTFTPDAESSKKLNDVHGGAIIIAASGMMTGGRILHHLKHNLWREQASLVIVGYQAEGTLGRALINGAKRVRIHGDEIAVRASIHTINGFSAHADKDDLVAFLSASNGAHVVLVHGEEQVMQSFALQVEASGRKATLPVMDQPLDL
jgi:metallo-beta-lactamase family protein